MTGSLEECCVSVYKNPVRHVVHINLPWLETMGSELQGKDARSEIRKMECYEGYEFEELVLRNNYLKLS